MKQKFLSILVALTAIVCSHAYAQYGIPYQAIARNSSGSILANQAIGLRFSIRDSFATGTVLYTETFNSTTDAEGLFNVNVGTGTVVSGNFNTISWGAGAKFMQMEMDQAGGSSYNNLGTQQLMAVPYALFAKNGMPPGTTGDVLYHDGTNWQKLPVGEPQQILSVDNGLPKWITIQDALRPRIENGSTIEVGPYGSKVSLRVIHRGMGGNVYAGIIWGTNANLTYASPSKVQISGLAPLGVSEVTLPGLLPNTKYYFRPYAYVSNFAENFVSLGYVDSFTTTVALTIGQNYQGGKIIYFKQPSDAGYSAIAQHGIVVATDDLPANYVWGCNVHFMSMVNANIGGGEANTNQIVSFCDTAGAAYSCKSLVLNGYDDWWLPNPIEADKIFIARTLIGGVPIGLRWVSGLHTEGGAPTAQAFNMSTRALVYIPKSTLIKVRPIRYF